MARDIDNLIKTARRQDWAVEYTRNGHIRFTSPDGERYTTGGTPSVSSYRNLLSDLKRRGLVYDRGRGRRRRADQPQE